MLRQSIVITAVEDDDSTEIIRKKRLIAGEPLPEIIAATDETLYVEYMLVVDELEVTNFESKFFCFELVTTDFMAGVSIYYIQGAQNFYALFVFY